MDVVPHRRSGASYVQVCNRIWPAFAIKPQDHRPYSHSATKWEKTVEQKIQAQGIHHITLTGADRQTSIDFWEGLLGFSLIFDQPNLDNASQGHLCFAVGNGQTLTVFTDEARKPQNDRLEDKTGAVHHLAFAISQSILTQVSERLDERGIKHIPIKDRGFMNSIYFYDPLGLRIELASVSL